MPGEQLKRRQDPFLHQTPHFHFQPVTLPTSLGIPDTRCKQTQTPVSLYLYLGRLRWKLIAMGNERLQVRCGASVLSMIKLS